MRTRNLNQKQFHFAMALALRPYRSIGSGEVSTLEDVQT